MNLKLINTWTRHTNKYRRYFVFEIVDEHWIPRDSSNDTRQVALERRYFKAKIEDDEIKTARLDSIGNTLIKDPFDKGYINKYIKDYIRSEQDG